jgi:hypothetical protein
MVNWYIGFGGREERAAIMAAGTTELVHSLADHVVQGREEVMLGQEVQCVIGFTERAVARQVEGCWLAEQ